MIAMNYRFKDYVMQSRKLDTLVPFPFIAGNSAARKRKTENLAGNEVIKN